MVYFNSRIDLHICLSGILIQKSVWLNLYVGLYDCTIISLLDCCHEKLALYYTHRRHIHIDLLWVSSMGLMRTVFECSINLENGQRENNVMALKKIPTFTCF